MDLLQKIIFKNCSNDFLPDFLSAAGAKQTMVKPSDFMEELGLSTQQRLEKIKSSYLKKKSKKVLQFDIIPNVIVFQNFKQGEIQTVPLSVINTSKIPCSLTFLFTSSPYFTISYNEIIPDKLAPGMELQCYIHFNPECIKDYVHKVKVVAIDKEYTVPIIAIGPRPVLNLPDHITVPNSLISIVTEKRVLVKNLGRVPGVFSLHTDPPFYVKPNSGILKPDENMQIVLQYKSEDEGVSIGKIIVKFDIGEMLVVSVEGRAFTGDIRLSKDIVNFEDTYLGLRSQRIIQLLNNSDHVIHFTWKKFNSNELDKTEGDKIKESLVVLRDIESKKSTKLEMFEVVDTDVNDKIYNRILNDEVVDFEQTEQFLYNDPNFLIVPISGDIWPNHTTDISLIFSPTSVDDISSFAYCKVNGRVDRLTLKLIGCGIGPKFSLNIETIDLDNIYLFSEENFEIVVHNNGDVPGQITFIEKDYDFGTVITCKPNILYLKPFEHGVFIIKVKPSKDGSFVEEILFNIIESNEKIKVIIKGNVVYAKLVVYTKAENFGTVALGMKEVRNITLYNKTTIDIPFSCTVNPDGTELPILLTEHPTTFSLPKNPKQYNCIPATGIVPKNTSFELTVELVPNTCKMIESDLCIDTWYTNAHRISVNLSHKGDIPLLTCFPNDISIRFCFINNLCQRLIEIKNKSNLAGYIWITPHNSLGISVDTDIKSVYLKPFETIEVALDIICLDLGKQTSGIKVQLFGGEEYTACSILCIGQGPMVLLIPEQLNFGEVKLLEYTTMVLSLLNDSPIPASLTIETKKDSPWSVSPTELSLEPGEKKDVDVTVYLNDTRKYKGKLFCNVVDRGVMEYIVTAIGVGTSITVEPSVLPIFDLKAQLTQNEIRQKFIVTNRGVRYHKILIAKTDEVKRFESYNPNEIKSIFNIEPISFALKKSESIEIELTGYHKKVGLIEEPFYFHAIIEKVERKQIIIETKVVVNFVEPTFYFSKKELSFRTDHSVLKDTDVLSDVVEIKNLTPLTITTTISLKHPFCLRIDDENVIKTVMVFEQDEIKFIRACFVPNLNDQHNYTVKSFIDLKYKRHTKKDHLRLNAEVNFPNIKYFPDVVDFGAIVPGSYSCYSVELRNVSPITVTYNLEWSEEHIMFNDVPIIKDEKKPTDEPISVYTVSSEPTIPVVEEIIVKSSEKIVKKDSKGKKEGKGKKGEKDKDSKKSSKIDKKSKTNLPKLLPAEFVFEHYYIEEPCPYCYIQIYEQLHDPISRASLIGLSEYTRQNLLNMKEILLPTLQTTFNENSVNLIRCMDQEPPKEEPVDQCLNIVPIFGVLEPFESQHLYISYYPKKDSSITASILCHIVGGPTEILPISGLSADIHFEIDTNYIDFGRQVFSEVSQKKLKLKNTGYVPFTFSTTAKETEEVNSIYILEAGCLTVHPRTGFVDTHSELDILLRFFPGVAGKFLEIFELDIAHLEPIPIIVSGYGVFPQVYLNLPRPSMFDIDPVICYEAIANLKSDFLSYVEHINVWHNNDTNLSTELSKTEKRNLQADGWSIISYDRNYPSIMDIDLAIERLVACKEINQQPSILLNKINGYVGLHCPPYIVNFGTVIVNTIAHYTISVLNYGPATVKIRLPQRYLKANFQEAGFDLQFKTGSIIVGDSISLYILFNPTSEIYQDRYKIVNHTIYLDVLHGCRIPLEIIVIVTKPYLITSTAYLQYDKVICGNIKTMNFIIKNIGIVPCFWKGKITAKDKKTRKNFMIKTQNGTLEPGQNTLIDIHFEPTRSGKFKADVVLEVEQNDEKFVVHLRGYGLEPMLKIDKTLLHFEPCVPYATDSIQSFSVENISEFPIEYYFADFDKQILEEEKVRNIFGEYYIANKMLMPERFPGIKLPQTYYEFIEEIVKIVQKENIAESDVPATSGSSPKRISKKKTKSELPVINVLEKNSEELFNILQEFIKTKSTGDESPLLDDPLSLAVNRSRISPPEPEPNAMKEGILFIFNGAPFTDFVYAANKTGKQLNLPVFNLDDLIYEALLYNNSLTSIKINELIDNAYQIATEVLIPDVTKEENLIKDEEETVPPVVEDPYTVLKNKVALLVLNEAPQKSPAKGTSSKGSATPKSNKSAASAKKKQLFDNNRTLVAIPDYLFIELLSQKIMEYKKGLVIESLKSEFIRQTILAFMTILHSVGNLKYIHLCLLYNDAIKYNVQIEETTRQTQINLLKQTEEMLEHFNSMTDEEFNNLSAENYNLYKNIYVAERQLHTRRRLEALKTRRCSATKKEVIKKGKPISAKTSSMATSKGKKSSATISYRKSLTSASSKSSDGKEKKKEKKDPALIEIYKQFEEYSKIYDELLHLSEYWDRKTKCLTKPFVAKVKSKGKSTEKDKKKGTASTPKEIIMTVNPVICSTPIGFPIWIINTYDTETIPAVLKYDLTYQDAYKTLHESFIEVLTTSEETFSILCKPTEERIQNKPNEFKIWTVEPCIEPIFSQLSFINDVTDSTLKCSSPHSLSQQSSAVHNNSIVKGEQEESLQERTVIQPGEIKLYSIRFSTTVVGSYNYTYTIELTNWHTRYHIHCGALCDIPRISMNPMHMFPSTIEDKIGKHSFDSNVYVHNENTFDFGYKLVCTEDIKEQRYQQEATYLTLRNISAVSCDISLHFILPKSIFRTNLNDILIHPGDQEILQISACPAAIGPTKNILTIAIKENPKVETITMQCTGCHFAFTIDVKKINFERILLSHHEVKKITLQNLSSVPVIWRFINIEAASKHFIIDPENKLMKPLEKMTVTVLYIACTVEVINLKLAIEVHNELYIGNPLLLDNIDISAETVDLIVQCPKNIDLGEIKARKDFRYDYSFLNRGKYVILFELCDLNEEETTRTQKIIRKMLQVNHTNGTLNPNKLFSATMIFNSYKAVDIKELPILECKLLDHLNKNVLSTFYVTLTAKTLYSTYEVYPCPDLNFGTMLIGTTSLQRIKITNTGSVEFNYYVLFQRTLEDLKAKLSRDKRGSSKTSKVSVNTKSSDKKSKKTGDSKSSKSKKDKKDKKSEAPVLGPPIFCGSYTCSNSSNIILPHAEAILDVTCNIKTTELSEETLIIFVSECSPKHRLGTEINLKVKGCIPNITYEDYNKIFEKHVIVDKMEEYIKPKELERHCVFARKSKSLTFMNTCINTKSTAQIQLYNESLVDGEVLVKIKQASIFTVEPSVLYIPPYSHGVLTITFKPQEIQMYKTVLELVTVLPGGNNAKQFTIMGEGQVPRISLKETCFPIDDVDSYNIKFDPVLNEKSAKKIITFENTGDVICKIIIEVREDFEDSFAVEIAKDTMQYLNCPETVISKHFQLLKLKTGDIANFYIIYEPRVTGLNKCKINIHVVNNPFDITTINVSGESFVEDIIFENILTAPLIMDSTSSVSDVSFTSRYGTSYVIDFGSTYLSTLQKTKFKIINRTMDTYKFVFRSPIPETVFIPAIGHLKSKTCKDVIVTFISDVPVNYKKVFMDCLICKIIYCEFVDTPMSWDERQRLIIYDDDFQNNSNEDAVLETSEMKLIEECPEPMYDVIEESVQRIPIIFSVSADFSSYKLDINNIQFIDTFMFDKRVIHFQVYNTSDVKLEIHWEIILDKNCLKLAAIKNESRIKSKLNNVSGYKPICGKAGPLTGEEKFIGFQENNNILSIDSSDKSLTKQYMPFIISPKYTVIKPKESIDVSITFAPLDIYEYKANLKGVIKNLSPQQKDIDLEIYARSLVPCCHFDVKMSDYITSGRRQGVKCDAIVDEENVKVVEMNCLGVRIQHDKVIKIRNPTDDVLHFSWQHAQSTDCSSILLFKCQNEKGTIDVRKIFSTTFSVFPQSTGTFESSYNFIIDKYDIKLPFLFVAHVRESDVMFLSANLTLKPAIIGIPVNDYISLKNNEDVDLIFKIKKDSLYSEGRKQCLGVEPRRGFIPKRSTLKIKICYNPTDIGEEYFKLCCHVQYLRNPLYISVTTKCYEVQLIVESYLFGKRTILNPDIDNVINLNNMMPEHKENISFCIRNEGSIGFYYIWSYNAEVMERRFYINLGPKEGYIKKNTEVEVEFNLTPLKPSRLKNYKIELKIRYGPTYRILLNAIAAYAPYKFSFMEYDFGPCFIQSSNFCHYFKTLEFYNYGMIPITLENSFINTNYLTLDFKTSTVFPKTKQLIYISFAPRKIQKYHEEIVFIVNTLKYKIKISGEGIKLDIVVVNLTDRDINLGSLQVGQVASKTVKVLNKCPITINAFFDLWDRLPINANPLPEPTHYLQIPTKERILEDNTKKDSTDKGKKGKKEKEKKGKDRKGSRKGSRKDSRKNSRKDSKRESRSGKRSKSEKSRKSDSRKSKKDKSLKSLLEVMEHFETYEEIQKRLIKSMVSVLPNTIVTIPAKRTAEFTINYVPTQQLDAFTENVAVQVLEQVQPLCVIKGACYGPVFYFDRTEISFGVVVLYCTRETKVVLLNEGDISSKFKCICEDSNFSISPKEGYSTAGLPVTFTIKYQPNTLNVQTKYTIQCVLEPPLKPLEILLIGMCANLPPALGSIAFSCPVRTTDKKSFMVINNTGFDWKLSPSITGEYFICPERFEVKAKTNALCDIIYEPLQMTPEGINHTGFVFIKLPDGNAIVYDLLGEAQRPVAVETRSIDVSCKTIHTEIFQVKNWAPYTQEFKIYSEDITPDNNVNLYEIKGLSYVEVFGNSEREYEWHFYAYKECSLEFRIIFMNNLKEYLYYQLLIKVTKPKPLDTIILTTCVRTPVTHELLFINPLDIPIMYKLSCSCQYITYPSTIIVEPHKEVYENITYTPLLCGNTTYNLDAFGFELGSFPYELQLTANPAPSEAPIYLSTSLGQSEVKNINIKNFARSKTTFTIMVDDYETFSVPSSASAGAGISVSISITYKPHMIGNTQSTMVVTSDVAGEYVFPLIGTCTTPIPKGPLNVSLTKPLIIDFTNPYLGDETFRCKAEPNNFLVQAEEVFILSKAMKQIIVSLESPPDTSIPNKNLTGKLTISSYNKVFGGTKWEYYLQGFFK